MEQDKTKSYKELTSGRVETCQAGSDVEKALIAQGYVEIDPETGEPKDKAAADKAAESMLPKPLNPNAKLTTEADDEIASVTVETKQPSGETDVTTLPKPLNEPEEKSAPKVPKKN